MLIFITGGTGAVCTATIPLILAAGHTIRALARSQKSSDRLEAAGATPVRGDITQHELLTAEASRADLVIYAAIDHYDRDAEGQAKREGEGIAAVCKGLEGRGKTVLAFFSLAPFPSDKLSTEQSPLTAIVRGAAANDALVEYSSRGVRSVQIRLGLIHSVYACPPILGLLAMTGKEAGYTPYLDSGANLWPAIDMQDVAALIVAVIQQAERAPTDGMIAVHAYSEQITTKAVVESLARKNGLPAKSLDAAELEKFHPQLAWFLSTNPRLSNEWTKDTFGWIPKGASLLENGRQGGYLD